jgi:hypothetical protein
VGIAALLSGQDVSGSAMPTASRLANSSFDVVGQDDHVAQASAAVVLLVDLDRSNDVDGSLRSRWRGLR